MRKNKLVVYNVERRIKQAIICEFLYGWMDDKQYLEIRNASPPLLLK